MKHVEFEMHFTEQAERFGIAKIIRQRGEEYAFQSFMLALSGIVARDKPTSLDEEKLDKLAEEYCTPILKENHNRTYGFVFYDIKDAFKAGFRKAR